MVANDGATKLFISDRVSSGDIKPRMFNLIVSGCGAGKTHFCLHRLRELYPDVKPEEILIATSRAITAQQQSTESGVMRIYGCDPYVWHGSDEYDFESNGASVTYAKNSKVCLTTYASLANLIRDYYPYVKSKKIIVIDECHALYVDKFMRDTIDIIKTFILSRFDTDTLCIGISATPEIVESQFSFPECIHYVLGKDERIQHYSAENFYCAYFDNVSALIKTLPGKTLVMCDTAQDCEKLHALLPYSYIVYGRSHKDHNANMGAILDYISECSCIPDGIWIPSGSKLIHGEYAAKISPIKTLISTTVMREGFNLREYSGIENIVCCSADPVNIIQFAGRCRFNIKNLIVAPNRQGLKTQNDCLREYECFINGDETGGWLTPLLGSVYCGLTEDIQIIRGSREIKWVQPKVVSNAFEEFMFDNYVSDCQQKKECWIPIRKREKNVIREVARESLYYQQAPSQFSVSKSINFFLNKFGIEKITERDAAGTKNYYIVDGGKKVKMKYQSKAVTGVDAMFFARYVNASNVAIGKLRLIPSEDYLDIKTRALIETYLGDRGAEYYSVERIINQFCERYGFEVVHIKRELNGAQYENIALRACEMTTHKKGD